MKKLIDKNDFKPKSGWVTIYSKDKEGNIETLLDNEKNLFVTTSADIIAGCLQGDTDKAITTLATGDGGVIDSEVQTPTVGDTSLYSEIFRKEEVTSTVTELILDDKYITFKFTIEKDESNGDLNVTPISELGLFSADGTMFSRKCFSEIIKTPLKELSIEWKITL